MSADVRVLVTGASGQLGGHAARLLAESGKENANNQTGFQSLTQEKHESCNHN